METCLPIAAVRMTVVFHAVIALCYFPAIPVALALGYRHLERGIVNANNHWLARLERASFAGLLTAAVAAAGLHYWVELIQVAEGPNCGLQVWQSVTAGFLAAVSLLLTGAVCWIVYVAMDDADE